MSHFLDRLTFFTRAKRVLRRPRRDDDRGPSLGGRLPQALAARQDRALDAWRELHGLLLVEGLRQGRHRHLGNPADRLSAHAAGSSQPRAARLRARRELQLVPLFRQPREISAGALAPAQAVARGARAHDAGGGLEVDRRGSEQARLLRAEARPRRLRSRRAGTRSTRSSPRPTPTPPRPMARTACSASRRSRRCRW